MKTKLFFKSVIALVALMLAFVMNTYATKHVLHMQNIVSTTQYLCVSSYPNDTIVFYTMPYCVPSYATTWKINNVPVAVGDSMVYLPTGAGTISVTSDCGTSFSATLLFYSTPPSHADFQCLTGGVVNSTKDTLWMCQNVVSLSSNVNGTEATYFVWYGPGGFISYDAPVSISTPGVYYHERGNPCGVVRDTIVVIQLPTEAPVWTDMTFCNVPVNLTLDPGPGWNYLWNNGATTQTLAVDTAGFYKVKLSNQCAVDSAWIQISQVNFPLPDLSLYSQIPASVLCQSEVAILDPNTGYTYDTYQWYKNGSTPVGNQPTLTVDYPALGEGSYSVEVTQGGCSATSMTMVMFYLDPQAPTHCVSSFDPITGTNMTVFEVINEPEVTEYVLSYKQGSTWIPVDTIAETGLSSYTLYDAVNDPNQQSQTYAVFARHLCGNLSPLGDWHKTIRISIFQDIVSGDYILQILDDYTTLSGYEPDSYTIWIDSLNDGNFTQIGILNGGNTSFTITSPVNGAAYYASVNLPWNCGGAKSFPTAFSNRKVFTTTDVAEYGSFSNLTIYPNPSNGIFLFEGEEISRIEITDGTGKLLFATNQLSIDLSDYAPGFYMATVYSNQGSTTRKLLKY